MVAGAAGHNAWRVKKHKGLDSYCGGGRGAGGAQLIFSFVFSPEPQAMKCCCPPGGSSSTNPI